MRHTDESFPLLAEGLLKLGIAQAFPDRIFSLLCRYIEEIELFNHAYGLVKVKDRQELIVRHILDSIAPLSFLSRFQEKNVPGRIMRIADVGSGAGFPGIPLAICMPQAEFTLIERMGRRAGFLRDAQAVLGLPNVLVEECEMEKIPLNKEHSFDCVVFRAFKPLDPVILKGLFRLLGTNGIIAAYKGRRESIEEEMTRLNEAAQKGIGPRAYRWEAFPLEVPFLNEERRLLVITMP